MTRPRDVVLEVSRRLDDSALEKATAIMQALTKPTYVLRYARATMNLHEPGTPGHEGARKRAVKAAFDILDVVVSYTDGP